MWSQLDPHKWYIVSLSCKWCKCDDYGPICKYTWALKMIVDEEFSYLLDLLPKVYEANGFMHQLDADELWNDPNDGPNGRPSKGSNKTSNEAPNDGLDNGGDFLKEKLLQISN